MPESRTLAVPEPEVRTLARPASGSLLAARTAVEHNDALRAVFVRARAESLSADDLARELRPELERCLEASAEEVREAALYLADEFLQVGDGILMIDRLTGRALARLSDEDFYQPAPVPRESGGMAQPLLRIRPDLEAFMFSAYHDRARDTGLLARVRARYPSALALQVPESRGIRPITRTGRTEIVSEFRERLPLILGDVRGVAGSFLDRFPLVTEEPVGMRALGVATATSLSREHVGDPLTMNLHHDRLQALCARVGTSWVRRMARQVAEHVIPRVRLGVDELPGTYLRDYDFWIVPPEAYSTFLPYARHVLPVEGTLPTGLRLPRSGCIRVDPESYTAQSREVFSRWEVMATVRYQVYISDGDVCGLHVLDLPEETFSELV